MIELSLPPPASAAGAKLERKTMADALHWDDAQDAKLRAQYASCRTGASPRDAALVLFGATAPKAHAPRSPFPPGAPRAASRRARLRAGCGEAAVALGKALVGTALARSEQAPVAGRELWGGVVGPRGQPQVFAGTLRSSV